MMKKNNIYVALLATVMPALLFTGCRFEDDEYFGETAAVRTEHVAKEVKEILVRQSAEDANGWVMQYFCSDMVVQFEGFNLFARFYDSDKVLLAGNHRMLRYGNKGNYTEDASVYEMLQEDGLVLAFNTWNDVLTPFVDPVWPWPTDAMLAAGDMYKDGTGMAGDHNFVVTSYNENEVILRGERWGGMTRLVACDRPWKEYIADTDRLKNYITNTSIDNYYVTNGVDTLYFSSQDYVTSIYDGINGNYISMREGLRLGNFSYCERIDNPVNIKRLGCVFTPNGFRLEKEQSIGENVFQEFTLSEDSTCLVSEDGQVKVIAMWDDYVADVFLRAKVGLNSRAKEFQKLDEEYFTEEQKMLYDDIAAELLKYNKNCVLDRICIGKSNDPNPVTGLVVRFFTNANKTSYNAVGVELDINKLAYGQIQIDYDDDMKADGNLTTITEKSAPNLTDLVRSFAATLKGRYEVVPDNYFLPTGGMFTAMDEGVSFRLVTSE